MIPAADFWSGDFLAAVFGPVIFWLPIFGPVNFWLPISGCRFILGILISPDLRLVCLMISVSSSSELYFCCVFAAGISGVGDLKDLTLASNPC